MNSRIKWNLLTALDAELIITNSSLEEVDDVLWNGGTGTVSPFTMTPQRLSIRID